VIVIIFNVCIVIIRPEPSHSVSKMATPLSIRRQIAHIKEKHNLHTAIRALNFRQITGFLNHRVVVLQDMTFCKSVILNQL